MLGAFLWIGEQLELEFAIFGFSDAASPRSRCLYSISFIGARATGATKE